MAMKIRIREEDKSAIRNPIAVALAARHGGTKTKMRDRRLRRSKDSRRNKEEW